MTLAPQDTPVPPVGPWLPLMAGAISHSLATVALHSLEAHVPCRVSQPISSCAIPFSWQPQGAVPSPGAGPSRGLLPDHPSCSLCSPQLVLAEVVNVQGLPSLTEDLLLLFPLRLLLSTLFL